MPIEPLIEREKKLVAQALVGYGVRAPAGEKQAIMADISGDLPQVGGRRNSVRVSERLDWASGEEKQLMIQIFESDNGDILQFQNNVNGWFLSEKPKIISMVQSESLWQTGPEFSDPLYHNLTITFLYDKY